jgi:hypothetical protein
MAMATAELTTMVGGPEGVLGIGFSNTSLGAVEAVASEVAVSLVPPGVLVELGVPAVALTEALPSALATPAVVGAAATLAVAEGVVCLFSSTFASGAASANCAVNGSSTPKM